MTEPIQRLERKNVSEPNDRVTVTARQGQTTAEGWKEKGESFEMPANIARINQAGGMVDIGVTDGGSEADVRQEAYNQTWDENKQIEKQVREARQEAVKGVQGAARETTQGQAGLAQFDSGNPHSFTDSQSAAEARLLAEKGGVNRASTAGEAPSGKTAAAVAEAGENTDSEGSQEDQEQKDQTPETRPGERGTDGGYERKDRTSEERKDYRRQNKNELVEEAESRGLDASDSMRKDELVEMLEENDNQGG